MPWVLQNCGKGSQYDGEGQEVKSLSPLAFFFAIILGALAGRILKLLWPEISGVEIMVVALVVTLLAIRISEAA